MPAPSAAYFGVNAADAATVDALRDAASDRLLHREAETVGAYRAVKRHLYVHGTVLPRESPFKRFYEQARAAAGARMRSPAGMT